METSNRNSLDQSTNDEKLSWVTPELVELDIDKGTKGNTAGPSTFDGGAFVSDYVS